jgi:hypothetical protein
MGLSVSDTDCDTVFSAFAGNDALVPWRLLLRHLLRGAIGHLPTEDLRSAPWTLAAFRNAVLHAGIETSADELGALFREARQFDVDVAGSPGAAGSAVGGANGCAVAMVSFSGLCSLRRQCAVELPLLIACRRARGGHDRAYSDAASAEDRHALESYAQPQRARQHLVGGSDGTGGSEAVGGSDSVGGSETLGGSDGVGGAALRQYARARPWRGRMAHPPRGVAELAPAASPRSSTIRASCRFFNRQVLNRRGTHDLGLS